MKPAFIIAAALLLMGAAATPKTEHDCTLTVTVEDGPKETKYWHWCHTATETLRMELPADYKPGQKNLKTGQKLKVRGKRNVDTQGRPTLELDGTDVQYLTVPAGNPQFSTIPNKTLVMVVSFANRPNLQSEAFFRDYYNRVVNPVLLEMALGTSARLVGIKNPNEAADVVAVTIPYTGGCDIFTITQQAQQAAQAKGFGTGADQYHRFSYHLPAPDGCGNMRGIATVGWYGGYAISLVPVDDNCEVTCHELLGHNLAGLLHTHSNTLNSPNCCFEEYGGDDFMGNHGGPLNPFQREIAGWYNTLKTSSGHLITMSGDYVIESIAIPTIGTKSLTIPTSDPNVNLYVAYYTQDGYGARVGRPTRVSIYTGGTNIGSSSLVACKVAPEVQWSCNLGDTFSYLYQPLTITPILFNPTQAVIRVTFAPPPPTSIGLSFTVTK